MIGYRVVQNETIVTLNWGYKFMNIDIKLSKPETAISQCIILGVFDKGQLTESATKIDAASQGYITKVLDSHDIEGKLEQTLLLHNVPNITAERVLLVGCGKADELTEFNFNRLLKAAFKALTQTGCQNALCCLTELEVLQHDSEWRVRQIALIASSLQYRFEQLKSKQGNTPRLQQITIQALVTTDLSSGQQVISQAQAIAKGMALARTLGNLPGNICTPSYLEEQAHQLAKEYKSIKSSSLNEKDMHKLGMNSFLSVSRGSEQPAKLIIMHFNGGERGQKPLVLVGKGITFDSGGISLKPGPAMDEMKFDMCGAASVFGTLKALAELDLPINVIGLVAASENLPGGNASKPGDIVKTMSGQSVEILNTDAEGRLVLCDTLTYAERFEPELVIDIATLTGAMVIALGPHANGLFSNDEEMIKALTKAGQDSYDRVWQMPIWDDYQPGLESNFADMANIASDRAAGSIMAACFLSRFTNKYRWAHLDIAGTAWLSGREKGATGRPVPLLTQFLIEYARTHSAN